MRHGSKISFLLFIRFVLCANNVDTNSPANIMLDVATLATSDANKPLLQNFVPLTTRAMKERGSDNLRLVKYSVQVLSQLFFEPRCLDAFESVKDELIIELEKAREMLASSDPEASRDAAVLCYDLRKLDVQAKRSSALQHRQQPRKLAVQMALEQNLQEDMDEDEEEALEDAPKPAPKPKQGLASKLLSRQKAGPSARPPAAKHNGNSSALEQLKKMPQPKGHVMISYNWNSQKLALELRKKLVNVGLRNWIDVNGKYSNLKIG